MSELLIGDIIFAKPTGLLFKLIRWYTKDKYGHVGIVIGEFAGKTLIVEARRKGIDVNALLWYEKWKYDYTIYRLKDMSDIDRNKIQYVIMNYVGKKYDTLSLFNFIFKKDITAKNDEYFCSELIYKILCNLHLIEPTNNPELVNPKKLRKLIEQNNYEIIEDKNAKRFR